MVKCDNTRKKYILYDYEAEQSTTRSLQFATILIAVLLLAVVVVPHFMDVRPVKAAPTEITSIDDLYAIRNTLDGDYILMNDLDFDDNASYEGTGEEKNTKRLDNTTDDGWLPIGVSESVFEGTFDGQNYTISNLFVDRAITNVGLFGYVGLDGSVINLVLSDVDVTTTESTNGRCGGLIGYFFDGTVENCHVTGDVTAYKAVGGLIGTMYNTCTLNRCSANCTVTGSELGCGGLAGNNYGSINNSFSYGTLINASSLANNFGGLAGRCESLTASGIRGMINNSYSFATVYGYGSNVGGLVGRQVNSSIYNSYSTGRSYANGVLQTTKGFVGAQSAGDYNVTLNCFWDNETSGATSSTGSEVGKYTDDMKSLTTYSSWSIVEYDEYVDEAWFILDGVDYPRLGWEYDDYETDSSFSLAGLTDSKVTWYGLRGESVWCNSSGTANETLQIQITCNTSVNVTNIDIYLMNMSYSGNYLSASNVTMYVSSNNSDYGSLGAFDDGGNNISINTATWNAGTMGTDPFPIGPSESFTVYVRFLLAIPSGDSPPDGTYVSTGFKVYSSGYS